MLSPLKTVVLAASSLATATLLCPPCGQVVPATWAATATPVALESDTATVHLHISGMNCGSCPTTARLAMERLPGVYRATVTLADSLGIVRYDPARVTPERIAAHLTKLTGFRAEILREPARGTPRRSGGE